MAQPTLKPLPPKDAFAYFRQKGLAPSFAWQDVWQDEHAKAFVIAKMVEKDQLEHAYAQVSRAIAGKADHDSVVQELVKKWKEVGWWGVQEVTDPLTGKLVKVQLGSERRARFIVETNARVANAAGRWSRLWANRKNKPYLMYVSRLDGRERPEHRAWHGTILPIDHPWWDTHYPPCGWRCRCGVLAYSEKELAQRGLKINDPVKFPTKQYVNPRTGEVSRVEKGIDPGWDYNVGTSPLRGLMPRAPISSVTMAGGPNQTAIKAASKAFLTPFKAVDQDRIIKDKKNWPITVGPSLFLDASGDLSLPRPDLIDQMDDVGRALYEHDKAEWVWREAGKGAPVEADLVQISNLFDEAIASKGKHNLVRLSSASTFLTESARKVGIDIFDYAHSLDSGHIVHIMKSHGDDAYERSRKQIGIKRSDFLLIPTILEQPDILIFGLINDQNKPAIGYIKGVNDGTYFYLEEISKRKWTLVSNTMYKHQKKFPEVTNATEIAKSLNVQNGNGANITIVDLRGKIKPDAPKDYPSTKAHLVRRYTKRLDNRVITVDLSKDTWTFDITPADKASDEPK